MFLQRYNMRVADQNNLDNEDKKASSSKEKVMSYEEKSVGSTPFYQCEACPYMALAEDDIKFHLFTDHPQLAKRNGLADNIQIPCPGCTSVFDAEETLRTHLRNHHKMGIKDVKKMVKSLIHIALKNATLIGVNRKKTSTSSQPEVTKIDIPQLIEIVPDIVNSNHEHLPQGVAFITVDDLNSMSTPNFENIDPKDAIQEASINIVYTNDVSTQYVKVSSAGSSSATRSTLSMPSVTPDLISSIQPQISSTVDNKLLSPKKIDSSYAPSKMTQENNKNIKPYPSSIKNNEGEDSEDKGMKCGIEKCFVRLRDPKKLSYHKKCHQNNKLKCPECDKLFLTVPSLHMHLWRCHAIDLELYSCNQCEYKSYKKYRLMTIHMKCHSETREYSCDICLKLFKNSNQLSKHRVLHKRKEDLTIRCDICDRIFTSDRQLRHHVAAVHEKRKPYKCSHCKYTAARKEELKLHMRSHTGDKPYTCNLCDYCTGDHNALRRHRKQHSRESDYKCKYCPYTAIQSTMFAAHMLQKHPNLSSEEIHLCSYCPFMTVNKEKFHHHINTHRGNGDVMRRKLPNSSKSKPSWTIPSESSNKTSIVQNMETEQNKDLSPKTRNIVPIEVYDCDSLSETMSQEFPQDYCTSTTSEPQQTDYNNQVLTDLSKDDTNSDCLIPEDFNIPDRHQYNPQHTIPISYESPQSNLLYLNTSVSMDQELLQSNSVSSLSSSHSPLNNSLDNNILSNFPIRLPPPPLALQKNITLQPVDKLSLSGTQVSGSIINQMQIIPITSTSQSPIHISLDPEGVPRKKPKISVKSNLILKGPDQVNMFHSQQKMAFKRLEDNERYGLGDPVTFNNLITTQFMQLQPESAMSESPNNIITYPQDTMLEETVTTPVSNEMNKNPQIFSFNQQLNVNNMTLLPPPQKIQTNDPSYIKLEGTIKQNTQSPSLEKMCNANILNNPAINREYKASPPLEDIHKNMNEIKNEVKSDAFYNLSMNRTNRNPPLVDQYMIDNIIPEQYPKHLDLSTLVLPEISDPQADVIEIDDNSDDNKLLQPFDMNFSLESLYLMHNDFHFLENDVNNVTSEVPVNEINRMISEIPVVNSKDNVDIVPVQPNNDNENFIEGKIDPMMNTSVRPSTNKINVKNIELMKN